MYQSMVLIHSNYARDLINKQNTISDAICRMNVRIVNSDCAIFNIIKEGMSISWLFIAANDCLNFWNQVNSEIIIKRE